MSDTLGALHRAGGEKNKPKGQCGEHDQNAPNNHYRLVACRSDDHNTGNEDQDAKEMSDALWPRQTGAH